MPVGSYGNIASNVTSTPAEKSFTVLNVSTVANVETSLILPDGSSDLVIRARAGSQIQLASTSGASGTTYFTISKNNSFSLSGPYVGTTLYFQTDNNDVVEIVRHN